MNNRNLTRWSRLDNTAKIFPSNSTKRDSKVFRFACELKETVEPEPLQSALDKTLERFPFFRCIMKRGLFWYYLEESTLRASVQPETLPPCAPIYNANRRNLLFRVFYYQKRISLEVYHVLADGTGGLQFLRTLVYYYLLERYRDDFSGSLPELGDSASQWHKGDDSFQKYYEKSKRSRLSLGRNAYRLRGERLPGNRIAVIEGRMSLRKLLACSHEKNVTLTEFMTSVLICAIHEEVRLRDNSRPVVITVPVNLRGYFPSESARNFFETINIEYDFSRQEDNLDAVLGHVRKQFREHLTKERLREQMNTLCAMEHNIPMRIVPLAVKNPALRIANMWADKKTTASFSNVGKVTVPSEMERYIHLFAACASPNMLQASACSFQDNYVISFAGAFCRHDVERSFFEKLIQLGIDVVITTNLSQME